MVQSLHELQDLKNQGKWEEALSWIEHHVSDNPEVGSILHAFIAIEKVDYENGDHLLSTVLENTPGKVEEFVARVTRMHLYWKTKQIPNIGPELERANELFTQLGEEALGNYLFWVALYYSIKSKVVGADGDLVVAQKYMEKGRDLYERAGDPYSVIKSMISLSVIAKDNGDYDRQVEISHDALRIMQDLTPDYLVHKQLLYMIKGNIASTHIKWKQYDEGLRLFLETKKIVEEIGSRADYIIQLINIGAAYNGLERFEEAGTHLEEAVEVSKTINNQFLLAYAYRNLSEVNYSSGDLQGALSNLGQSLELARTLNLKIVIASNLSNIGFIKSQQGDLDAALQSYMEVMELVDREQGIFDPDFLDSSYQAIATVYARQNDFEQAQLYLDKRLVICHEINDPRKIADTLFSIFMLAFDTGSSRVTELTQEIQAIAEETTNRGIILMEQLSKALLNKSQGNGDKATEQLSKLVDEFQDLPSSVFSLYHKTITLYNLCELYIEALRQVNDSTYLEKAMELTKVLNAIAENQQLLVLRGETSILQAKMKVLEFDMVKAHNILLSTLNFAETNGLLQLVSDVREEIGRIITGDSFKITELSSLQQRIEETEILVFLRSKGGSRGSYPSYF